MGASARSGLVVKAAQELPIVTPRPSVCREWLELQYFVFTPQARIMHQPRRASKPVKMAEANKIADTQTEVLQSQIPATRKARDMLPRIILPVRPMLGEKNAIT
jgi:hypothetical protein